MKKRILFLIIGLYLCVSVPAQSTNIFVMSNNNSVGSGLKISVVGYRVGF
jgi:hypothetical protein